MCTSKASCSSCCNSEGSRCHWDESAVTVPAHQRAPAWQCGARGKQKPPVLASRRPSGEPAKASGHEEKEHRAGTRDAEIGRATGWLVKACVRNAKASGHEGKERRAGTPRGEHRQEHAMPKPCQRCILGPAFCKMFRTECGPSSEASLRLVTACKQRDTQLEI